MSDEMPNTIWCGNMHVPADPENKFRCGEFVSHDACGGDQYHRTDWLRSQIVRKKITEETDTPLHDSIFNAALDQILNLLETGEKK